MQKEIYAFISLFLVSCSGTPSQSALPSQPTFVPVASIPATPYIVAGTVQAGGVPVANALVDLLGTGQAGHYTFTRSDGSFRLVGTPQGPIVLRTGKWGFQTQVVRIVVDGDVIHNVTLEPGNVPQPLAIGASVGSVVKLDDTICMTSDPGVEDGDGGLGLVGPCKTFLLTIPQDGRLVATARWLGKDMYMTVLTPSHGKCCSSPLTLTFPVTTGSKVELGVSIHASDMLPLGATAPFELTTTLEPSAPVDR